MACDPVPWPTDFATVDEARQRPQGSIHTVPASAKTYRIRATHRWRPASWPVPGQLGQQKDFPRFLFQQEDFPTSFSLFSLYWEIIAEQTLLRSETSDFLICRSGWTNPGGASKRGSGRG